MINDSHARYRAGDCVDCGEQRHSAGRPRCESCHRKLIEDRNEGRAV